MTTTASTGAGWRKVSPDDAITSVVGYLQRMAVLLPVEHAHGEHSPASLRELADGLSIMDRRLRDAAEAIAVGASSVLITDAPGRLFQCTACGEIVDTNGIADHGCPERSWTEPDRF